MISILIVTPKKQFLAQKRVISDIDVKSGPPVRAQRNPENKVKKRKGILKNCSMWQVTCMPRLPKLSQLFPKSGFAHVWSYPQCSYVFQVSSKSVQGFWSCRGSKFSPFPLLWLLAFTTGFTTIYAWWQWDHVQSTEQLQASARTINIPRTRISSGRWVLMLSTTDSLPINMYNNTQQQLSLNTTNNTICTASLQQRHFLIYDTFIDTLVFTLTWHCSGHCYTMSIRYKW